MPAFEYKAVDKSGRSARGKLDAANEVDLELRLRKMGLDLITTRLLRSHTPTLASGSITRQDLITFCFDLEQISRAGIPILEGLRDLPLSILLSAAGRNEERTLAPNVFASSYLPGDAAAATYVKSRFL